MQSGHIRRALAASFIASTLSTTAEADISSLETGQIPRVYTLENIGLNTGISNVTITTNTPALSYHVRDNTALHRFLSFHIQGYTTTSRHNESVTRDEFGFLGRGVRRLENRYNDMILAYSPEGTDNVDAHADNHVYNNLDIVHMSDSDMINMQLLVGIGTEINHGDLRFGAEVSAGITAQYWDAKGFCVGPAIDGHIYTDYRINPSVTLSSRLGARNAPICGFDGYDVLTSDHPMELYAQVGLVWHFNERSEHHGDRLTSLAATHLEFGFFTSYTAESEQEFSFIDNDGFGQLSINEGPRYGLTLSSKTVAGTGNAFKGIALSFSAANVEGYISPDTQSMIDYTDIFLFNPDHYIDTHTPQFMVNLLAWGNAEITNGLLEENNKRGTWTVDGISAQFLATAQIGKDFHLSSGWTLSPYLYAGAGMEYTRLDVAGPIGSSALNIFRPMAVAGVGGEINYSYNNWRAGGFIELEHQYRGPGYYFDSDNDFVGFEDGTSTRTAVNSGLQIAYSF